MRTTSTTTRDTPTRVPGAADPPGPAPVTVHAHGAFARPRGPPSAHITRSVRGDQTAVCRGRPRWRVVASAVEQDGVRVDTAHGVAGRPSRRPTPAGASRSERAAAAARHRLHRPGRRRRTPAGPAPRPSRRRATPHPGPRRPGRPGRRGRAARAELEVPVRRPPARLANTWARDGAPCAGAPRDLVVGPVRCLTPTATTRSTGDAVQAGRRAPRRRRRRTSGRARSPGEAPSSAASSAMSAAWTPKPYGGLGRPTARARAGPARPSARPTTPPTSGEQRAATPPPVAPRPCRSSSRWSPEPPVKYAMPPRVRRISRTSGR